MSSKIRVRELSQELGITNKELLHMLREENIYVKSHMSGLTEEQANLIREKVRVKRDQEKVQKKVTREGIIIRRRVRGKEKKKKEVDVETKQPEEEKGVVADEGEVEAVETKPKIVKEEKEPEEKVRDKEEVERKKRFESKDRERPTPFRRRKKRFYHKKRHFTPKVTVISRPEDKGDKDQKEKVEVKKVEEEKRKEEPIEVRQEIEEKKLKTEELEEPKVEVEETPLELPEDEKAKEIEKEQFYKRKEKKVIDVSGLYEEREKKKAKTAWKKRKEEEKVKEEVFKKPKKKRKEKIAEKEKEEEKVVVPTQPMKAAKRKIKVEEAIRVGDLAQQMSVKAQDVIKKLMELGVMAAINQSLDIDTASIVASEFGYEVEKVGFSEEKFILPEQEDRPEDLKPRPPVVTIMGHVDHGKTSLLDAIRESRIAEKEAGGITQHIGAYHVKIGDNSIVFLDTPGHEAFTDMRARGAQVTDIVVLVVAADDGVMDQTVEAINHAKAAEVPIVVAINKIDKDNAEPERVKRELADYGLIPEEWGGDTIFVEVSAKKRIGIEQLLEMILLQAEVMELKANPDKRAKGHIIEAKLDKGRGPVGTVLIKEGTLHIGDAFICGIFSGKVRSMFDDMGRKVNAAGPSIPVEVVGFNELPMAGDEFIVVENEKIARQIAETRQLKQREKELAKETKLTLETFLKTKEEDKKVLNLILKTDVHGSLEAIRDAIMKLQTDELKVDVIHGAVGPISESDVKLAIASSAIIIGFNVRPNARVKELAEKEGVDIRFYSVIYDLVNEVKDALAGMLTPIIKEVYLGQAEVRQTFNIPKIGTIAGCFVVDGKLQRNAKVRLIRDGIVIHTGKIGSLKRFKEDVREVSKGYECGVGLENFNDIKVHDIIEAFEEVKERPTL